jgi:hypothetical protein
MDRFILKEGTVTDTYVTAIRKVNNLPWFNIWLLKNGEHLLSTDHSRFQKWIYDTTCEKGRLF